MNRFKSKPLVLIITAIITVVVFAVMLFSAINPLTLYKWTRHFGNDFDTTSDFVKFIDVGQGDCALIYSNGQSALIDLGEGTCANDVAMALYDCKIDKIDVVLLSHLHSDHIGGLPKIANLFEIRNLIMSPPDKSSISAAHKGRKTALKNGADCFETEAGLNFNIGEFEVTLLYVPDDSFTENNRSVFVMAKIGEIEFLFTGDAEKKSEQSLLNQGLKLDCDVLKVAHHGSDTSTSTAFLDATTPEYAVISVGEGNEYGLPDNRTLRRLKNHGAEIYRTDQSGDITFNINDGEITVGKEN